MDKWLDNFGKAENANEGYSRGPADITTGTTNKGLNSNGAWGGQFKSGGWLDQYQHGGKHVPGMMLKSDKPTVAPKPKVEDLEGAVNTLLGYPHEKGRYDSQYKLRKYPDMDPEDMAANIDNIRHPAASMYTVQGLKKLGLGTIPSVIGANVMGAAHEASTLFGDSDDNRSLYAKLRESGEDIFNNAVGSVIETLPMSMSSKRNTIQYLSDYNLLPDGSMIRPGSDVPDLYNRDEETKKLIRPYQDGGKMDMYGSPIISDSRIDPNESRSYYDPRLNRVTYDKDYLTMSPEQKSKLEAHENYHAYQFANDRTNFDIVHTPDTAFQARLQKKPQMMTTDEVFEKYHNRKQKETEQDIKDFRKNFPGHDFVPDQMIYNKVIDHQQYGNPYSVEGEAEHYQNTGQYPNFQSGGGMPGSVGFSYARTQGIPSNGPHAKKTLASAQDGKKVKPKLSEILKNIPKPDRSYDAMRNQAEANSAKLLYSGEGEKQRKAEQKAALIDRKKRIQESNASPLNTLKGVINPKNWSREELAKASGAIGDKFRIFPNEHSKIDEYLNPGVMIGDMASALGQAPLQDKQTNSVLPLAMAMAAPMLTGAMEGIGTGGSNRKFVNNLINPLNSIPGYGAVERGAMNLGKKELQGVVGSRMLNREIAKGVQQAPIPSLRKIDPIQHSSVNVQSDLLRDYGQDAYNQNVANIYNMNRGAYDMPNVEFKGSRPASYFRGVGANAGEYDTRNYLEREILKKKTPEEAEGLLFKQKFCEPGSPCAKSANAVTNRMYTDITGQPFDVEGSAHNAWHMQEQMLRNQGMTTTGQDLKIGDRVLMGNEVDQSTYAPGFTADPRVRHAGTVAGMYEHQGERFPVLFESGKNNAMYLNHPSFTFTGKDAVKETVRPEQFIGDEFGKGLVDKNIRYAYRDKPSVASYSSNVPAAQNILSEAEKHRETIKRTYDLTNDEFDELTTGLVGIGAQETKLSGALPGSKLAKAKIKLQDALNTAGVTKPIKQTLNAVKGALNKTAPSNLPAFPGISKLEMEAAKLSDSKGISFNEALSDVKGKYQPKPKYTKSTAEPSKGMFRQKFQTEANRVNAVGKDLKGKHSLVNALGLMSENYQKVKELYPDANPRQLMDLTTLMWNSPGKAKNKELVDFYLMGKNNPNPEKFSFDYLNKVKKYKQDLINIQSKGAQEPYYKTLRKEHPEIQYQDGGIIDDEMGQWAHPGEITRIPSNDITMEGVPYPVLGISDTGDEKLMKPGKNYKFKGKKVTEYPISKDGNQLIKLDQLTNFTNYNTKQPGGWLDTL